MYIWGGRALGAQDRSLFLMCKVPIPPFKQGDTTQGAGARRPGQGSKLHVCDTSNKRSHSAKEEGVRNGTERADAFVNFADFTTDKSSLGERDERDSSSTGREGL